MAHLLLGNLVMGGGGGGRVYSYYIVTVLLPGHLVILQELGLALSWSVTS